MKIVPILAMALALAASAPALATDGAATPAAQTPPASPAVQSRRDPNRVICREEEELGSRVHKRRTCLTSAQWRELASQTGRDVEQRTAQGNRNGGG